MVVVVVVVAAPIDAGGIAVFVAVAVPSMLVAVAIIIIQGVTSKGMCVSKCQVSSAYLVLLSSHPWHTCVCANGSVCESVSVNKCR